MTARVLAAGCLLAIGSAWPFLAASAQTPGPAEAPGADGTDLIAEIGLGGRVQPSYLGSDEVSFSPSPILSLSYLRFPGLFEIGGGPRTAFSIGPSFRVTGARDPDDHPELAGTRPLDATYEVGVRAGYDFDFNAAFGAELYGEARWAFGEAEGLVGNVGVQAIVRPTDSLELRFGPRASFAASDYVSTYFSVSPAESLASGGNLAAHDAGAGLYSVGLQASARYEFRSNWFLNVEAGYERLIGDAGDSPIVAEGSADQFSAEIGISHRFSLDLF
jgi:outer membrane scaffolding protein for murein synthesis (MipA/OmpV family)